MNQENKVVKISDVIQNQIPEFILSENPNFLEFLKQYYVSQEYQGSSVDLVENLVSYKNIDSFDTTNLISETTLTSNVDYFSDVIEVESTNGWPKEYGLLKIDDEIITYTGITSTSFIGCIRGFSGVSELSQENAPEFLVFSETEVNEHSSGTVVKNLSNLFLKEFFRKIKYQFTPGFEELDFAPQINPQNFISKVKSFYQKKGTDEAFKILFKVLYAEDVKIIKPYDYCFTTSDDKWRVVETFVCELVSGNPFNIEGQTLYQDDFPQYNITNANGSIYNVESFVVDGQTFYKLQIFAGYSNNLNPKGSIQGTFTATPKTFVVEDIATGSTVLTVDSTVGFDNEGTLEVGGLIISYKDKTNDQFLNCSGITSNISRKTKVYSDHYVYAYENESSNIVRFKLCNVLSKFGDNNIILSHDGDPIQIDNVGSTEDSAFLRSLVYNISTTISCGNAVESLTSEIRANQKEGFSISNGSVLCKTPHYLRNEDIVDVYIENLNLLIASNISVDVLNSNEFLVPILEISQQIQSLEGIENLDYLLGKSILFRRHVKKSSYADLGLTANIQDSYVDDDSYYITSNGLPEYRIVPLVLQKTFYTTSNYDLNVDDTHHFYSGNRVTVVGYEVTGEFKNNIGIFTGSSYYVYTDEQNNFKINLSQTKESLGISSYIPLIEYDEQGIESGRIESVDLILFDQYNQTFGSSKLFKKFYKTPQQALVKEETTPGSLGVFVNGIELRNYKSFDKIYYGPIESVSVLNSGSDYNLCNPPQFKVTYTQNNVVSEYPNTNVIPQLKGTLIKLPVINSGFDYVETPKVRVLGGNNFSVVTEVKMKNVTNEVEFNATTKGSIINVTDNTFNFNYPHRFVTGEPVIYKTFNTSPIGIGTEVSDGYLSNDSIYYVVNIGAGTSMSLAFNRNDAFSGTNLINLRTFGGGFQSFISTIPKKGIDEVNITQNETDFEYKKLSFIAKDVNLLDNIITIKNHGFLTGEEVVYSWKPVPGYNGASIGGLAEGTYYYIVKIDDNRFKLSIKKNKIDYVNLTSTENYSTYFIEYSPIRVEISGTISVNGLSTIGYAATIAPIVTGSVVGASIQNNPPIIVDNFGDKNILNYEKSPKITIINGEGASLQPLINDGKISQVIVKSSGSGYYNSFDLVVEGDGFGAKLNPVVEQGKIVDVKVVNGGVGYASTNTRIDIVTIGNGVKLKCNLKSYSVNDVTKYGVSNIRDGLIFGSNYSLVGNTYGIYFLNSKLRNFLSIPNTPTQHSPIVGWAYDGCPIYGPYAYTNPDGTGGISRMRSGYRYNNSVGSIFNLVEEYEFTNSGTLDEHNGRFCVTPEYPDGVYAYFCTFNGNGAPTFPYVIGPKYNYKPIEENFDLKNNQTKDLNKFDIIKWSSPYRVKDDEYKYEYFDFIKSINPKDVIIEKSSIGTIDKIDIVDPGINYQVNDVVVFDNSKSSGFGANAIVSEVSGVEIENITSQSSTIQNVTFISDGTYVTGITSTYHSLKDSSFINISNISSNSFKSIEGFKRITVPESFTSLSQNIDSASTTGTVTSISVTESITSFNVDDQLSINGEIVKIIGLDYQNNLLNILRPETGPSHIAFESVEVLQNKFSFFGESTVSQYLETNNSYYFNPEESVSIGSNTSAGVGNTLTINPLGSGIPYVKYVQTGGIYLPNNKFNTGDQVIYDPETSSIVTNKGNLNSFSKLYVVNLDSDVIGIVTSRSNISDRNNLLTYTSAPSGNLHKFTTNKDVVEGTVLSSSCVVSTASTHGLSVNDSIRLEVVSGITTTFVVRYSNSRVLLNSQVNPKINVYANDTVIFDISHPSLSGLDFGLFTDEEFSNAYFGVIGKGIEVEKTSDQLKLTITKNTPRKLFYNLSGSVINLNVSGHNEIEITDSNYNSRSIVTEVDDNEFTFNLNVIPERTSYTNSSDLSYYVLSEGVLGPISNIQILSKGVGYKKLPSISSVLSEYGDGCNLFANSSTIGKVEKIKINNTNLICPFDKTLKPQSNCFSALKLIENYSVKSIKVVYGGKNYITAPNIKLYNRTTNEIISNFSGICKLKNNSVDVIDIINPGYGLKTTDNQIVFTDNTNGFKIIDVAVTGTSAPFNVTLTLKTPSSGFTTSNPLPISVGDEIFVEGIVSSGNGFNSSNYDYDPFVVTFVDPAYGSQDAAIIRYRLQNNPGSFNSEATYNANVIPYSYIPEVKCNLEQNEFYNNEFVNECQIINNSKNTPITNLIKVKQLNNLSSNNIIIGKSSKSRAKILEIDNFNSNFISDYSVSEVLGGSENRGYLSSNIQKLSDNDYYQKFSYSLKSNKQFEDWNSPVSDTSHIAGYKKFSDLYVESVGIGTTQSIKTDSSSTLNVILDSYVNVNSISNYDLVNEIDIDDTEGLYSEYLKFGRLKMGGSLKSTNNRVLSIDDISSLFTTQEIIPKVIVDSVFVSESTILKYQFYLTSTNTFFGQFKYPEIFELFICKSGNVINSVSYSSYNDVVTLGPNAFFGTFNANLSSTNDREIILTFQPTIPFISVDIKAIKESVPNVVGVATTSFGYFKNIEICKTFTEAETSSPQTIYSIPSSECNSGAYIIGISSAPNNIEKSFESSFINQSGTISITQYAENIINDLGKIDVIENGSNIEFKYIGISGIGATVYANLKLLTNNYSGYDSITKVLSKLSSSRITTNSSSTGISTISAEYGYTKYVIEILQNTGITTNKSIVQLNSIHTGEYLNNILYNINGNISMEDLTFVTDYNISTNDYTLYFNPVTSADYTLTIYESSLLSPNQ